MLYEGCTRPNLGSWSARIRRPVNLHLPAQDRFHGHNAMTCRQVSEVAARCSYAIYLGSEKDWNSSRVLLVPRSCKEPTYEIDASLR